MDDVGEIVFGLFGKHKRITDNECFDYTTHPFYEELERKVASHGAHALDAIEECIFHPDFKRFDSVYRAVYFCGYSGQEHLERKTLILKRVLESHTDWIVRYEAVDALHDMKRHDMIKGAYAKESNENVKKAMTRWLCKAAIRGEFRNIHIGLLLDAFLEYNRNALLSDLKSKNVTLEKDIHEYFTTSWYPQNIFEMNFAFLSEDSKKLVTALAK